MCRNIRMLFNFDPPATDDEVRAAATQYVRKVAGTVRPSKVNEAAFEAAIDEIADITRRLVREQLATNAPPHTREEEAERARERGKKRENQLRIKLIQAMESS
jgi:hypothetical protein